MMHATLSKYSGFYAAILAVALFFAVNIAAGVVFSSARFDLTEGGLYTLSKGTRHVLKSLKEPMRLRFFYAPDAATGYPQIQSYAARVRGVLEEYARRSRGQITLETINPEPFSEEEDLAVSLGIQGIPVDTAGTKFYFGLSVAGSTDTMRAIPFFDPERAPWLEYDLTRMIHDLARAKQPKIGVMSWIPMLGGPAAPMQPRWAVLDQIAQGFDIEPLATDLREIPADIDVLMLVHPANPSDDTLYAMDQFLLKGGRALIFTDPYTNMPGTPKQESYLERLYHGWGYAMKDHKIVADRSAAIRVRNEGRGSRLDTFDDPTWLALDASHFNRDDAVTAELQLLRMVSAGFFVPWKPEPKEGESATPAPAAPLEMTPLVVSGPEAGEMDSYLMMFNEDPLELLDKYNPVGQRLVIAARFDGMAASAFPERAGVPDHLAQSKEPIHIIAVADADLLRDGIWVERQQFFGQDLLIPTAHNGIFILNALDRLSGSSDLISLRSRGTPERPFDVIEDLRQQAEVKFRTRERELQSRLSDLEQKLDAMENPEQKDGAAAPLGEEQSKVLMQFRDAMVKTRQELRAVQRSLQQDIERLGDRLKWLNIGAIPALIVLLAFLIPGGRLRLKRRARRA